MNKKLMGSIAIFGVVVVLAGCSDLTSSETTGDSTAPTEQMVIEPGNGDTSTADIATESSENIVEEDAGSVEVENKEEDNNSSSVAGQLELPPPDRELSDGEYRWSQLLERDSIFPVYDPEFAPADTAPYDDNELVIGVEINGEAKAYAIGPLNSREMVNDMVGGVPVLVTW